MSVFEFTQNLKRSQDEFLEIVYPTYNQTTNIVNQQMSIFDLLQ